MERADGPFKADPIQIGFVKVKCAGKKQMEQLELNILPSDKINKRVARITHRIERRGNLLYKDNKELTTLTPAMAHQKLTDFLEDTEILISHGDVDVTTINAWCEQNANDKCSYGQNNRSGFRSRW